MYLIDLSGLLYWLATEKLSIQLIFFFLKPQHVHVHFPSTERVLSHVHLFVTPWTMIAHQAPLFMEFFKQEYWSGLLLPSPEDLPDPGFEPMSHASPALAGEFFTTGATWEAAPHSFLLKKKSHVISNQLDQGFSAAALLTFGII